MFLYDNEGKRGYAFANQTGDVPIFYINDGSEITISNNLNVISDSSTHELNEKAAHYLLTYGFILGDNTIIKDVKRLGAGECIEVDHEHINITHYHSFTFSKKLDITIDEACERLDDLFRNAVKRCFDKDLEYGANFHLVDLSAGLDSRMVNWVAKDLGYKNIINISYSQSKSDEEKSTKMVSDFLGNRFFYRPLDDANFLYDIEEITKLEFGLSYYCGITGGWDFLKFFNFFEFGLEHTGQIGDAVIGSFVRNGSKPLYDFNVKRNSNRVKLRYHENYGDFESQEQFVFYSRLTNGTLSTHNIRSNFVYAVSPFMDIDLLNFSCQIPDELRENHRLYWYWIDKKYPLAGQLPSSRLRLYSKWQTIKTYPNRLLQKSHRIFNRMFTIFGFGKSGNTRNNMNPYSYWYDTNSQIRNFIDDYYEKNIKLISNYPELSREANAMINSIVALDKLMAISMLAAVKVFCKT